MGCERWIINVTISFRLFQNINKGVFICYFDRFIESIFHMNWYLYWISINNLNLFYLIMIYRRKTGKKKPEATRARVNAQWSCIKRVKLKKSVLPGYHYTGMRLNKTLWPGKRERNNPLYSVVITEVWVDEYMWRNNNHHQSKLAEDQLNANWAEGIVAKECV